MDGSKETLLPSFLLELSNESMKAMNGGVFKPRDLSEAEVNLEEEVDEPHTIQLHDNPTIEKPTPIKPSSKECPVVAVDVSSVRVGESEQGLLYSLRGAIVWREGSSYNFTRCGPVTFHLNDDVARSVANRGCSVEHLPYSSWSPMTERLLARLRNSLERWMQELACSRLVDGIILLDGSLTAGTPDNPTVYVEAILRRAREKGNRVMAFSKETRLCYSGRRITRLLDGTDLPCILNIDRLIVPQFPSAPVRLMGRVYLAKLGLMSFPFRVDVDRQLSEDVSIETFSLLMNSDLVEQGYPETLRLAHILSTFTANEVLAIQRHLSIEYGLKLMPRLSLRRSLFGPFGTSTEAS
ncbi:MAG: DNA double-strand break repair nuclease NurA [Candidatus Bathyarchaeia archaeon]